ncbi:MULTISPECIES: Fe-S cluster assembly protein SufD [unclassified Janibacter]|uniref:Fe-S cluster assembly protein SufD n=1 Tax=unclassified Janibacter TaxID=2649294 RepID=UPI003D00AC07
MSLLADTTPKPHTDAVATFVPDQSRAERTQSFDVSAFPQPTGREEEWRFTPVDRLGTLFAEGVTGGRLTHDATLPDGVTLTEITSEQARALADVAPGDRAAVLAVANADGALRLDIPAEAELDEPVRLQLTGQGGAAAFGHVVVTAGHHSRATVVIGHDGTADYSEFLTIVAGDSAELTVVSLQEWEDESLHLGQQDVVVGRDASVKHIVVTLGGKIVRLNTNASYAGPGGSFEGLGVYFADAGQHQEHRLFVDHEAPHCTSNVEYKGALQGETAHTVWVGDVLIRAAAEGTDTYELNRNLVLTDGARADSVPNLEIETGEIVGAGHASATGRFDDLQLFYLQARGIPEDVARRLVVRGFFASIISRIGVPEVADRLMEAIDIELGGDAA